MGTIFEQARAAVSGQVIESLLATPGAYWENGEYWTRNPTRGDRDIGSFSISEAGLWHDFADDTSGDLIALLVAIRNCTKKEAAEEIIKTAGGVIQDDKPRPPKKEKVKQNQKFKPVIPAPEDAKKLLNAAISAEWAKERYGSPVKGWTYRTAEGDIAFCTVRYEKKRADGTIAKDVVPFFYAVDGKWHNGNPLDNDRPLYKLDEITREDFPEKGFLIVEGEKCADVPVPGYIVTTWPGGCAGVTYAQWGPLEVAAREGKVIIWPDADAQLNKEKTAILPWHQQPGQKAALAIAKRLPGSSILDVEECAKIKDGYDIADAQAAGVDLVAFIEGHQPAQRDKIDPSVLPYTPIGVDHAERYVLSNSTRQVLNIKTKNDLFMLAPLSTWEIMYADREKAWFDSALSDLTQACIEAGYYSPSKIRGRGAWHDDGRILYHAGDVLIDCDTGARLPLHEYRGRNIYEACEPVEVGAAMVTAEEGQRLAAIISGASWKLPSSGLLLSGWLMIAPICGALNWRPHIWLSGPTQTGKSTIFKLIVEPVLGSKGDGALSPSGATSEAGLRQSLGLDAFPCYVDEFETDSHDRQQQVQKTLFLFRQASSGGTIVKGTVGGKSQEFTARSAFLVASTVDAIDSTTDRNRITTLEIIKPDQSKRREQYRSFRDGAVALIGDGFKVRFRSRAIRHARGIMEAAEIFADAIVEAGGDSRLGDQLGALLAGYWYLEHDDAPSIEQAREVSAPFMEDAPSDAIAEERRCLDAMLHAAIRFDDNQTHTVIELVNSIRTGHARAISMREVLAVHGIKYDDDFLDIAPSHDLARKLFGRYEGTFKELLRRIGRDIGSRRLLGKGYQMIRIDMAEVIGPALPWESEEKKEDGIPF